MRNQARCLRRALSNTAYLAEGEAVILRPQGAGSGKVLARLKAEDWARLKWR